MFFVCDTFAVTGIADLSQALWEVSVPPTRPHYISLSVLSFGYSNKKTIRGHAPVGLYGNGFKSGSMRLGKDVIVFSKTKNAMSVGLLSQTYLKDIKAQQILVPIITCKQNGEEKYILSQGWKQKRKWLKRLPHKNSHSNWPSTSGYLITHPSPWTSVLIPHIPYILWFITVNQNWVASWPAWLCNGENADVWQLQPGPSLTSDLTQWCARK